MQNYDGSLTAGSTEKSLALYLIEGENLDRGSSSGISADIEYYQP